MYCSHSVTASSNLSKPCRASTFNRHPLTPSHVTESKYITLGGRERERERVRESERERVREGEREREREYLS